MTAAALADPQASLILSRSDVATLMDQPAWLEAAEIAFRAHAADAAGGPLPMAIAGSCGTFHAKGTSIQLARRYVALKLNGNFPDNPGTNGLPTIQGVVLLCCGDTGALLAIIDSIEVTLRRTAAATALAARLLVRGPARTILLCGCGEQAGAQLAALRSMLPLEQAFVWDRDPLRSKAFAAAVSCNGFGAQAAEDLEGAAQVSDVIVTCTTSSTPFLHARFVRPGTFVAAVGADSPEKSEIDPALMAEALVVVDSLDQCAIMGDLHHALAAGAMVRSDVHAQLGGLLTDERKEPPIDDRVVVFDSTGIALQDAAAAVLIHRRARSSGAGNTTILGA